MEFIAPVCAAVALVVAFALASWVKSREEGTDRMKEGEGLRTTAGSSGERMVGWWAVL